MGTPASLTGQNLLPLLPQLLLLKAWSEVFLLGCRRAEIAIVWSQTNWRIR
jgi:hypothetical protein